MTFAERVARAQVVLGAIAVTIGVWGFVMARTVSFGASTAPRLGSATYEVQAMSFNRLGALVVVALGVVGIVAGVARRPWLALVPSVGFAMMGVQVLLQWRPSGANVFASVGSNLAFSMLLCAGFATTTAMARFAADADEAVRREHARP